MPRESLLIYPASLVLSALLTGAVRRYALVRGLLDVPNVRSSHGAAIPRGGGLSIVAVTMVGGAVLAALSVPGSALRLALIGGGLAVAAVGFLDDRYGLPAGIRLAVHAAAAGWALYCLGGLPPLRIGEHVASLGWGGDLLALAAIIWTLNLFNFMDGIDGIAASEAVFVTCAGALLALARGLAPEMPAMAFVFAAACCGFLVWNWPPAKIFMGDVGSGFLGYAIACFALAAARENPVAPWVWLILGGVFFVDATVTLLRRLIRREQVHQAHRSHAYQRLARRWKSHGRVTVAVLLIDILWLLPCAVFATLHPTLAVLTTLVALVPLAALAIAGGSGRREALARV